MNTPAPRPRVTRCISMDRRDFDVACQALAEAAAPFQPDLVLGIATGGARVAERVLEALPGNPASVTIKVSRPATVVKQKLDLGRLLRVLPEFATDVLRRAEVLAREQFVRVAEIDPEVLRQLSSPQVVEGLALARKVLIVDDTVDSGNTLRVAQALVRQHNPDAEMRTAVIASTWRKPPVTPDYCLHERTLIRFFWSFDSVKEPGATSGAA